MRINPQLLEKIKESLSSVLPITAIVLLLSMTITPLTTGALVLFLFGAALLIVGVGVFTLGVDMSMTPMGHGIGVTMSRARHMAIPLAVAFVLGVLITVAEPDLTVLAEQVPAIPNQVLILTVSAGVGAFLVIALLRTILHIPLSRLLVGSYLIVFVLAIVLVPNDFIPVSFDSGGVTTGPITVPFIMALGVGLASVRSDRNATSDSFGLVALCSVGPILSVLVLGICYAPDSASYVPASLPDIATTRDAFQEFTAAINSYRISATEGADTYGWYEATGITATSDEVIWRAETSEKFGEVGGSVPYIMGEYFKALTEAGEEIVPGSESHWTLNPGASEDAEAPAEDETPAETETPQEPAEKAFTDVPEGKWYTEAVAYVVEAGLMEGAAEGTFAPKAELTGEELAAIAKAMDADATVAADGTVTREALVKFLFAAAGIEAVTTEENLESFGDQDQISEDAVMMMNWAVGQGILTGRTENQLAPQEAVTRAECAVMLMRCAEAVGQ